MMLGMNRLATLAFASLLLVAAAAPARASSMPRADFGGRPVLGLGLGNGLSVGLDVPLSSALSLGGSFNAGFVTARTSSVDLRLLYKLVTADRGRFQLDLLGGMQGGGPGFALAGFEPVVGVAMAYGLLPRLTLRLNLATGVFNRGGIGPSGIELGYDLTPTIEGTLGGNGRGDFLGLKILL
jgi:hypothetical protein